jgi:hypothetical protein
MPKFRKKPVVIEAEQYRHPGDIKRGRGTPLDALCFVPHDDVPHRTFENGESQPHIDTLEGPHFVNDGDWVIRGVAGECYPCKPDIFEATYEPA